jgi:hypothetical protein
LVRLRLNAPLKLILPKTERSSRNLAYTNGR